MKIKFNKNWKPRTETGENSFREFNRRFPIDQNFEFLTLFKHYRIRFVKHPHTGEDCVKVFIISLPRKWLFWKWKKQMGEKTPKSNTIDMQSLIIPIKDCEKIYGLKL